MTATRIPATVQQAPFGSVNPAGRRRVLPKTSILQTGPAQGLEQTGNRQIDALQQRIAAALRQIKAFPFADCNLLIGLTLVSGQKLTVQHGLGRRFVSCFLCGQSATGTIAVQRPSPVTRPPSPSNVLDESQITITPNFSGMADLVVF